MQRAARRPRLQRLPDCPFTARPSVGYRVGTAVGFVGLVEGTAVGHSVGNALGYSVGTVLGVAVGNSVGSTLGIGVASTVGIAVGAVVGTPVGLKLSVTCRILRLPESATIKALSSAVSKIEPAK